MPSERSSASAITGLNALRTNARSISLQTCIRPFCSTERVIGSSASCSRRRHSVPVQTLTIRLPIGSTSTRCARLDHGRAVELLDDRRPLEPRRDRQPLAHVDRRVVPAAGEPDRARRALRIGERRRRAGAAAMARSETGLRWPMTAVCRLTSTGRISGSATPKRFQYAAAKASRSASTVIAVESIATGRMWLWPWNCMSARCSVTTRSTATLLAREQRLAGGDLRREHLGRCGPRRATRAAG